MDQSSQAKYNKVIGGSAIAIAMAHCLMYYEVITGINT